jgi:hypothetical protein
VSLANDARSHVAGLKRVLILGPHELKAAAGKAKRNRSGRHLQSLLDP